MTNYEEYKEDDEEWKSIPFYSGPGGYKLCLKVYADGDDDDDDSYGEQMALYVSLMEGEYDDRLRWPFRGEVTIQIVNWIGDHSHHKYTVKFDDSAVAAEASDRVWDDDGLEWGDSEFISRAMLESTSRTKQYIKNDCIKFRVSKVVVYSR